MLVLSADSLVSKMPWPLTKVVMFPMEVDEYGLTMFNVEVMNQRYFPADIWDGELTTVVTVKMLVFAVETLVMTKNVKVLRLRSTSEWTNIHYFRGSFSGGNITTPWPTWPPTTPSRNCAPWEFRCRNGQCIDQSYFCDGRYHCSDSSDEDFCNSAG
jgi:hypothetical protein